MRSVVHRAFVQLSDEQVQQRHCASSLGHLTGSDFSMPLISPGPEYVVPLVLDSLRNADSSVLRLSSSRAEYPGM